MAELVLCRDGKLGVVHPDPRSNGVIIARFDPATMRPSQLEAAVNEAVNAVKEAENRTRSPRKGGR